MQGNMIWKTANNLLVSSFAVGNDTIRLDCNGDRIGHYAIYAYNASSGYQERLFILKRVN